MRIVDVNLLLYAINSSSPHHEAARAWLEACLSKAESVAFPWVVLLGFLRLSTSSRVFPDPLTPSQALETVDGWLARPAAVTLAPGRDHWSILKDLVQGAGTAANLTTDAHLAALAIEHGAELHSTDTDFARFAKLRWVNLLRLWEDGTLAP